MAVDMIRQKSVCGRNRCAGPVPGWMVKGLLVIAFLARTTTAGAQAPADFTNTLLASVSSPTALAFTPDGRLLIATQLGQLRVYQNGALVSQPALNLNSVACTSNERGLLGVAVDPGFASNNFIYLFYTFNDGNCVNRVSRFVLPSTNQISMSSELGTASVAYPHSATTTPAISTSAATDISISAWVTAAATMPATADAPARTTPAATPTSCSARFCGSPDGSIPRSNPYRGSDSSRCNVTGRTTAGRKCQETFALGPAQSLPNGLRSECRGHTVLHQRRRTGSLGRDRSRPGRCGLRLEHAGRGSVRRARRPTAPTRPRD